MLTTLPTRGGPGRAVPTIYGEVNAAAPAAARAAARSTAASLSCGLVLGLGADMTSYLHAERVHFSEGRVRL